MRGTYGLQGPNGAGKSTLMRTIATLQSPSEGAIRFGDIDIIAEPERYSEHAVNRALRSLLARHRFRGAPHACSIDLVSALRA